MVLIFLYLNLYYIIIITLANRSKEYTNNNNKIKKMTKVKGVIMKKLIITSGIKSRACELDDQTVEVNVIKCGEYDVIEALQWLNGDDAVYLNQFAAIDENDHYNRLAIVCEKKDYKKTFDMYHRNDEIKARLAKYPHLLGGKHSKKQESIKAYNKHYTELNNKRLQGLLDYLRAYNKICVSTDFK